MAEVSKDKKSNTFKYIIIFILFLAVGVVIGFYGTTRYFEQKEEEGNSSAPEIKEITEDSVYQDTIKELYSVVNSNTVFYSSEGLKIADLNNYSKLSLVLQYMDTKSMYEKEALNKNELGNCEYGFVLDPSGTANIPSLVCTVYKYKKADITSVSKKVYNTDIETNNNFVPEVGRSCVSVEDEYICGNTATPQSGALEIKFDIQKVMLDPNGTIEIYDKGYLADRRAGVDDPNDQYDNYYLHTSDSTNYYYELKSADNVTFKHTFKTDDNTNYYYVSTEVYNG